MLTYWETLIAARSNIAVNDSYAQLWGRRLSNAYSVATYTGTLPTTLTGTKAGYLESYKIYGNTEQDGTPTPENPIMPSGCGERTGNLWDENYENISAILTYKPMNVGNGSFTLSTNTPLAPGGAALFLMPDQKSSGASTIRWGAYDGSPKTVTSVNGYITLVYRAYQGKDPRDYQTMLTRGSTALPYEPYGYKLPILSNSTVTNIYLGEVETTRRIKKLVLTGEETMYASGGDENRTVAQIRVDEYIKGAVIGYCNILKWKSNYATTDHNRIVLSNYPSTEPTRLFYLSLANSLLPETSLNGIRTYLQQQYANGTPVTVWYVLAEPETVVVNEPLMKIGDYADTVSMEQTGVSIPTSAGSTTISWAGEGLAPSEVEFVYKVKR
ncbi:MAG: hypothetical protein IIZ09_09390 [Ruminococcus sp.]|nr:hypothetical protein [Ruminococcus sp.]